MPLATFFAFLIGAQGHRPPAAMAVPTRAVPSSADRNLALPTVPAPPELPAPPPPPLPAVVTQARPVHRLVDYIDEVDYPAAAIRAGEQGRVSAALYLDADGHPAGCMIRQSSGSATLDEATCRIVRARARFLPARGVNGQAVPSVIPFRINWVLPPMTPQEAASQATAPPPPPIGPPPVIRSDIDQVAPSYWQLMRGGRAHPLATIAELIRPEDYPAAARASGTEGRVRYELIVGPDGGVMSCRITISSGSPELDAATCRLLAQRARYEPARGWNGRATTDFDFGFVQWTLPQTP